MEVQLRESVLEIPTRELLPGSVNPPVFPDGFHAFPYNEPCGTQASQRAVPWRTVELENEYLLLIVLPDMGGRVARLYDKIAGRDIFLPVGSVNPEWQGGCSLLAPGGLRFEFPASPTPQAVQPVNWLTRRYPDGSASILLGAIERTTFMNWKVELKLTPGLALLEQTVEIVNPTDKFNEFSCWTCADLPKQSGMRMCCPFDWRFTRNGYAKWPMDGAVDSSEPGDIRGPYETYAKLSQLNFSGAYWPEEDFGVAHAVARKRVKGTKLFVPPAGEFVELRTGPFEEGRRLMRPHTMFSWREYWFGARGIGPIAQASRNMAAAVERTAAGAVLKFSANAIFEGCTVRLTCAGNTQECRLSLYPECPTAVEFNGVGMEDTIAVDVFCRGMLLLSLGHGAPALAKAPDADLLEGIRAGHAGLFDDGYPLARGRALLRQRNFLEAADYFAGILRADTHCDSARYFLACALKATDAQRARRLFYDISADAPTYEASVLEAAALNIRLGDPYDNLTLLMETAHPWGKFLLSVSKRLIGTVDADMGDPGSLDEYFLAEQYLCGMGDAPLKAFTGSREEQLACIACVYAELGLEEDCLSILSLAADPGLKTALFKALFGRMKPAEALGVNVTGVFVNEPPLLGLLETCADGTGKAAWLLGCFRYAAGQPDAALQNWQEAYAKGLRQTALLYALGRACALAGDAVSAERYLREDIALHGSSNAGSLALLCDLLRDRGDAAGRLELLPALKECANPAISTRIAEALVDGLRYAEALEFMRTARFDRRCFPRAPESLWSQAAGALALEAARAGRADEARGWAGRLFAYPEGMPGCTEPRRGAQFLWTLGRVYRLTGDAEKSREAFRDGAAECVDSASAGCADQTRWVNLCQEELRF